MKRLPCEQYAVGNYYISDVSITVGIYYEPATGIDGALIENVDELSEYAHELAQEALRLFGGNHTQSSGWVKSRIEETLPGRPFYVETDEDKPNGSKGVQVYQPYGMPVNDADWPDGV